MRLSAALLLVQYFEVSTDCGGAPVVNDPPGTQLVQGDDFGCNLENGTLRCYGKNDQGQLGRGMVSAAEPLPAAVVGLPEPVAQASAGEGSACARTVSGRVFCWGRNDKQQLGAPAPPVSPTPLEVILPVPAAHLSVGGEFVLAAGADGRAFGWGSNSEGMLGRADENMGPQAVPMPVSRAAFELRLKRVASGQGHACGLDGSSALWCWGRNGRNELGANRSEFQLRAPVKVMDDVSHVSPSSLISCAIRQRQLLCWSNGVIDNGSTILTYGAPTVVPLPSEPTLVDGFWFHHCALGADGQLSCWGRGLEGQLGLGSNFHKTAPLPSLTDVVDVAVGRMATCARRRDSTVWCTGMNTFGQLGLGDFNNRNVFTAQ